MDNCKKSDLIIEVKAKRKPRFKAGSDLSSKVNRVSVDLNDESLENHDLTELKVQLFREECGEPLCIEK